MRVIYRRREAGRIDDVSLHHVDVVPRLGVENVIGILTRRELADDEGAVGAGIHGDVQILVEAQRDPSLATMSDFLSILRSRNQDVTPAAVGAGSI